MTAMRREIEGKWKIGARGVLTGWHGRAIVHTSGTYPLPSGRQTRKGEPSERRLVSREVQRPSGRRRNARVERDRKVE